MATQKQRESYPKISAKHWWTIRDRFKQRIPSDVTPSYISTISTILGAMTSGSASSNVIAPLKVMGLLDKDGKPTERAERWRLDEQYSEVCAEIVTDIYPQELRDAVPPDSPNQSAAENWFMRRTGGGNALASRLASTYTLLNLGDVSKQEEQSAQTPSRARTTKPQERRARMPQTGKVDAREQRDTPETSTPPAGDHSKTPRPTVHIDLQIHISPEASLEQIDQLFASMAKHLYERRD